MTVVSIQIPVDVEKILEEHKEVNWLEIASNAIVAEAKRIDLLEQLVEKSKLTEEDVIDLDHKIKQGLSKRYSK